MVKSLGKSHPHGDTPPHPRSLPFPHITTRGTRGGKHRTTELPHSTENTSLWQTCPPQGN